MQKGLHYRISYISAIINVFIQGKMLEIKIK